MFEQLYKEPGAPDLRSGSRFLVWLARRQAGLVASGAAFGVLWMTSQAAIPLALGAALGAMVRNDEGQVELWALVILALGILQAAAGILRHRRALTNYLAAACRAERLISAKSCELGADLSSRVGTGEIASLGSSDVERLGEVLDLTARFSGAVVAYAAVSIVLLVTLPVLGLIVVMGVPLSMAVVSPLLRPLERRQTTERETRAEASSLAADTVAGLRVLRGLGGERVFAARFAEASNGVAGASIRTAIVQSYLDGAEVLLPGILVVAVTWAGATFAVHGEISPGKLVAFYASAAFLLLPMQTFVEAASRWTAALVAARRVIAVLQMERTIGDHPLDTAGKDSGTLAFSPVLYDSLGKVPIRRGVLTAVVPATPEEGTALLDRLGRYAESPEPVLIDGIGVADLSLAELRQRVLVLERSPVQLAETLSEIFAPLSRELSAAEIRDIAAEVGLDEVVDGLADGYDTRLPERWRSLSGGQRQRLALARAIAATPEILLLDDPTSAVDAHTEAFIADALRARRSGLTTVIVTTSPLLLDRADDVLLLDGVVLASGPHRWLLANEPRYNAIVNRGLETASHGTKPVREAPL